MNPLWAALVWGFGLAVVALGIGPMIYLAISWWKYRKEEPTPEAIPDMPLEGLGRLEPYEPAIALQLATNRAHNASIRTKLFYQGLGIAAASGAPALVLLASFGDELARTGLLTRPGVASAEAWIVLFVLTIVIVHRRPSASYCRTRLRAELLRIHLHAFLIGVGPYASGKADAGTSETLERRIADLNVGRLRNELQDLEYEFVRQTGWSAADWGRVGTIAPDRCRAYVSERCLEQEAWFSKESEAQHACYDRSTAVITMTVVGGLLAAVGGAWFELASPGWPQAPSILRSLLVVFSATGVFVLGLRMVFNWDARAELYDGQFDDIRILNRELLRGSSLLGRNGGLPDDEELSAIVADMRAAAAGFEAYMSREAWAFGLISDRRAFDVSI
jgi:hypothetical protein